MRTTVRLPDDLMRDVKRLALETDRSLTRVIEDALRAALTAHRQPATHEPVALPTDGEGGLLPGVDLDDTASLLEVMEQEDPHPSRGR